MLFTKKIYPIVYAAIALVLGFNTGCKKKINIVNDISPVSTALSGTRVTIERLAQITPADRTARLQYDWPHLAESVVYYARAHGLISGTAVVDRVLFYFGDLDNARAQDGSGTWHMGYTKDQLVARMVVAGQDEPVYLFVVHLSRIIADHKEVNRLQYLGTYHVWSRFIIGPLGGLVYYVDYPLAIDLAERFHLPLYDGREMFEKNRITPAQARLMEPDLASTQVTVRVFEGDRFDLIAGTYTPAPKKIVPVRHHKFWR